MNKLLGFFQLKRIGIPSVPWRPYDKGTVLNDEFLWTIRSAVLTGDDQNLPRLVGATAKEATVFAEQLLDTLGKEGMVIYYPYFIALKSGNLDVHLNKAIIEGVYADLWNLVTLSKCDVTIQLSEEGISYQGSEQFFSEQQFNELTSYIPRIRRCFQDVLLEGKSVMLEWSYARQATINQEPVGDPYLVFYEARTVS